MSLRDEMAKAMCAREEGAVLEHWKRWIPAADALMPLVERAVREAARAGVEAGTEEGFHFWPIEIGAIVARVTGKA